MKRSFSQAVAAILASSEFRAHGVVHTLTCGKYGDRHASPRGTNSARWDKRASSSILRDSVVERRFGD